MSRRKGRILAFQALYSWDVTKPSLDELLTFSWLKKNNDSEEEDPVASQKEERTFATLIISGTIEHIDEIDSLIESHLSENWSKERLNKVTLAILRTSIYQIKFQPDANNGIIIDEAVNIAKEFGADDSYKFINAVLDKIGKNEVLN
ncbi:MAG: transcription antitermination factor NusB [Treponema sp.]|nr:transcription antitermination factor NusB [Treponema sp.]